MGMLHSMDHSKCFFYEVGENPIIEILRFEEGKTRKPVAEKNKIVFVIEGGIVLSYKRHPEINVTKGHFCFIPSSEDIKYRTTHKSVILVLRLQDYNFLCGGCKIEQLFNDSVNNRMKCIKHDPGISTLGINGILWNYIDGLRQTIADGLNCRYYYEIKIKEMSTLLSSYYSQEELQDFFSPVLSPDMEYSEFVRRNHHHCRSVSELAASMHMTPKNFAKKFNTVFGETPYLWMNRERAKRIYMELYSSRKTIIEVADEYGFLSQAHLNKYCKREFGMTPGEIRKGKKVQKEQKSEESDSLQFERNNVQ